MFNPYGSKEAFEKALSKHDLSVGTLILLKEIELKVLIKTRKPISKAYKATNINSEEEAILEEQLGSITAEVTSVKKRLERYRSW